MNKGKLKNVGFIEALKLFQFDCVIFHDVDLAPINYYNSYQCDQLTKHMMIHLSVAINTNKFKLPYKTYIGGVLKISTHHFITVNGYSNDYWGLDNENDDNFEKRLKLTGIKYIHVNDKIGQYLYIPYTSLSDEQINSHGLDAVSYKVITRSNQPFFTHLRVLIKQS
ncbi:putative beta-1,4-galactosyltransferase [Schistosoma mansoni]|uniref:putative beta-1,4-galactosyltransferase n=1 Tax=Schistosoma mansoni TaxID=6183 RepID=UPI0001A642A4|nr:putative beta-1,4-galactosyltransferase [Schistosoma mansoni]|eukprot:XP_018652066.1 putative beta-1,4-galactosyltransferase [Schistosoma mansoni]